MLILLGTLASGDVKTFTAAFQQCTGEVNPHHAEHKIIHRQLRDEMLKAAASYGRIDMLRHLRDLDIWLSPPPAGVLTAAASRGQMRAIEFLLSLDPPCVIKSKSLYEVAKSGQLAALKYLKEKAPHCPWLQSTTLETAIRGHLDVLQWMSTLDTAPLPMWRIDIVLKIVRYRELNHILKWLLTLSHVVIVEHCASSAIMGKNLDGLKLLRQHNPPCPLTEKSLADAAITNESLDILEYLQEEGYFNMLNFAFDRRRYCNAAARVRLPIMQWLRSRTPQCQWYASTMAIAAECGNRDVMQWAREQDPPCPWNHLACIRAVQYHHLDLLRWLRSGENPCPWGVECCDQAAIRGDVQMMQFLRIDSVPPCPWDIDNVIFFALEAHDLQMLKWLRGQNHDSTITRTAHIFLLSRQQYDIRTDGYILKDKFKLAVKYLASENLLPPPWNRDDFLAILNAEEASGSFTSASHVEWVKENVPELDEKLSHWMYYW